MNRQMNRLDTLPPIPNGAASNHQQDTNSPGDSATTESETGSEPRNENENGAIDEPIGSMDNENIPAG